MADANSTHKIAHDASNTNTMMILTPDQRAALTGLLVNGVMDTGSNRVAALYRGVLTSLSELSPCTIDITEEMALAGAKTLATTIRMDWMAASGRVDSKYPAWKVGAHANAHQEDYIDLSRASSPLASRRAPTAWSNIVTSPPKVTRQNSIKPSTNCAPSRSSSPPNYDRGPGLRHRLRGNTSGHWPVSFRSTNQT